MIALSWSRISDYRQCPAKFRMKYLDKLPNFQLKDADKNPHLVRGGNVHKQLDKAIILKNTGHDLADQVFLPEVQGVIPLIDGLMQHYSIVGEMQVAVNENYERVDWYSRDAYFRVIFDFIGKGNDLLLGDWKTGKLTDYSGSMDELGQLHMSAVVGFSIFPEFDECSSMYVYVDHKKTIPCQFTKAEDLQRMRDSLDREHLKINEDQDFVERKNPFCRWCEATYDQCIHKRK